MRSLTLEIGLKNSSLARIFALTPCSFGRRLSRTSGVTPIVSVIEFGPIQPRNSVRSENVFRRETL